MKTLFVFYTFDKGGCWTYPEMSEGWKWIGAGSTSAMDQPLKEYTREEQFGGPAENIEDMKSYLHTVFSKLVDDKKISIFKIEHSYLP
jgi:hypothetical protein